MKNKILFFICFLLCLKVFSQSEAKTNDINRRFDPLLFPNGITTINVYTNANCGRCENIVNMLQNDSINFKEYSVAEKKYQDEVNLKIYNTIPYKDLGISIGYPVFEIDSVVFFHIENHVTFTTELINFLKEQKKNGTKK